jgi:hypothetical protein
MKIFVAHATSSNFKEELYQPLRESSLDKTHEIHLPQEHGKQTVTKEFIKSCDLIIAECSFPSTGQGIELGWANIYQVPILCIYKKGIEPSKALHYVTHNFITYENADDMISQIETFIKTV